MFEWIDPFAKIAKAELQAERAHDNVLDAQEYAERLIRSERQAASYEIGHLRAVNAWMMEQLASLSPPCPISLVLPIDMTVNLKPSETQTATEVAARIDQRSGYFASPTYREEQRRMNLQAIAALAAINPKPETSK